MTMKKIKDFGSGITLHFNDFDEYEVRTKLNNDATYFTNDVDDAFATAKAMLRVEKTMTYKERIEVKKKELIKKLQGLGLYVHEHKRCHRDDLWNACHILWKYKTTLDLSNIREAKKVSIMDLVKAFEQVKPIDY